MQLKQTAIDSAAALFLNKRFWIDCKMFVQDVAGQTGLTNAEKHAKVVKDLIIVFGDIGETLLDIGVKLAVLWLKSQAAKK